jgi:hypothetical protein
VVSVVIFGSGKISLGHAMCPTATARGTTPRNTALGMSIIGMFDSAVYSGLPRVAIFAVGERCYCTDGNVSQKSGKVSGRYQIKEDTSAASTKNCPRYGSDSYATTLLRNWTYLLATNRPLMVSYTWQTPPPMGGSLV